MKLLETKGLHIYSTPPALNVKYPSLTRGQLPTPQSATFNLWSKKSGSDRNRREDAKRNFLYCLLPWDIFIHYSVPFQAHENQQVDSCDPQQKVLQTWVQHQGIHACCYTSTKSTDLMVAWSTRMLEHQHSVWRRPSHSSASRWPSLHHSYGEGGPLF